MATTPVVTDNTNNGAPPAPQPITPQTLQAVATVAATTRGFKSVMEHILKYATLGLVDIVKYAPSVGALALVMFPTTSPLAPEALAATEAVAKQILNTIALVQAKYASAAPGTTTNAMKLADATTIVESTAIPLLTKAGVPDVDLTRIQNAIEIGVSILKNTPVTGM